MLAVVMPWPSVWGRIRRAWLWAQPGTAWTLTGGATRREAPVDDRPLPRPHPNLLWVAIPDVVGDADATLEQFRAGTCGCATCRSRSSFRTAPSGQAESPGTRPA